MKELLKVLACVLLCLTLSTPVMAEEEEFPEEEEGQYGLPDELLIESALAIVENKCDCAEFENIQGFQKCIAGVSRKIKASYKSAMKLAGSNLRALMSEVSLANEYLVEDCQAQLEEPEDDDGEEGEEEEQEEFLN